MKFSWDTDKDSKNYEDHGIHLGTAAYIFNDPYRIERPDVSANNNTLENRWQTLGRVMMYFLLLMKKELTTKFI